MKVIVSPHAVAQACGPATGEPMPLEIDVDRLSANQLVELSLAVQERRAFLAERRDALCREVDDALDTLKEALDAFSGAGGEGLLRASYPESTATVFGLAVRLAFHRCSDQEKP